MNDQINRHLQSARDVDEAALFIAESNPDAAFRFLDAVEMTYRDLAKMPEIGAIRQFAAKDLHGLRMARVRTFERYLVFYRPIEGGIEVLRVLHSARDIRALFDEAE